jgi:hypothetical protein
MTNEPDINAVLIDVRRTIATAKIAEFERQCFRLGDIIRTKLLIRPVASDILLDAALSNNLVREHGEDIIQEIIAEGLGPGGNSWPASN